MNQGLHRVIFNAARGLRMVVAETANGAGKGNSKGDIAAAHSAGISGWRPAVFAIGWTALAALSMLGVAPEVHAQIVPNPFAAAGQKPQVLVAPNGVPLVNITTPSAAGVSINQYNQFDVNAAGAILNNSRTTASTQLGGLVQGNSWLATGPARIIVNQVSSSNPSHLNGYIEVAGQRAEVIIANPSGIQANGAGFINTSRATLTTGTPQYGALGTLDSFLVQGGTITVDGKGLDLSTTDYAAILSRALQVNAAIYASELKAVTGANQISADHAQVTPTAGTGSAPTFALDVSALGGMYAKKITLIGNEAGLGVRNAGNIGASAGNLVVTAAGRLENTGTLEGQSVQISSTGSDPSTGSGGTIDNRGGTIRQTSTASLAISAPTLSNTNGGWIGTEPLSTGSGTGTGATGSTGVTGVSTGSTGTGTTTGTGSTGTTTTAAPAAPPDPGAITATSAILNDGGKIYAGGPITLQSPNIVNTGGTLSVANMALNQQSFSNHGGTLNVSGNFSANVASFDNSTGTVRAGNLNIATTGDLINVDGTLTSDSTATLNVGGKVDNTRGTISATSTLTATVAGNTDNTAGTLAANQGVQLATASLSNDKGAIQASAGPVQLTVTGALNNGQGSIGAGTDLTIQAGSLVNASGGSLRATHDLQVTASGALTNAGSITAGHNTTLSADSVQSTTGSVLGAGINTDGTLASTGDLSVTAANELAANSTNLAAGNASLQGASVDVGSGTTSAANIALTATSGNVTTSGAKVVTPGTLAITANGNAGQTLVNNAGTLNAGQLQINASNVANTNGGEIVQTGIAETSLAVSGTLNNDGGRIASNSQDLILSGASITNTGGRIEHAGTGTLAIGGGSFSGSNGQITGNGALVVSLSGAFSQDSGMTTAQQITVDAGALSNRAGEILQTGSNATRITAVGTADNTGGSIASNGNTTVAAGSLTNQGGTIRAAGTSNLAVSTSGLLDNSNKGEIGAGGNTTVNAGSLNNDTGRITAVGALTATVAGAASNQAGILAANGNTTVNAGSLNNNGGTTAAVNGALAVTASGATTNAGGTLQAGGATTLSNAGLDNTSGKVFGDSVAVDTHGQQLSNGQGTIAATNAVNLQTGALLNDAGLIQSGGSLTIDTHGQALSNTNAAGYTNGQGGITSADTLTLNAGTVTNTAGYVGAKGALTASTQGFSNTGGGIVLGQTTVAVNTNGATYDNTGGQTQAVGDLGITAGGINNTSGLIRSLETTMLSAGDILNANTQGTDQGIEGKNVTLNVGNLSNSAGAIRSDINTAVTSGGSVNNVGGLISAGDTLAIVDPDRANPSAKTLVVTNTGGTLIANNSLQLDARSFSGDGTVTSAKDLSIVLRQDLVNNAKVSANGNLTYSTSGTLTNNGQLLAGGILTVGGSTVSNNAGAEMTGTVTTVNAGTLNNRGLIDSQGETRINAGVVNNVGSGRIYGDHIAIAAGTLNNDTETVNGSTQAGSIASRGNLDLGVGTLNNREHALIFSVGDMSIGGSLGAEGKAIGRASAINNASATIESLGNMKLAADAIYNTDAHMQVARVDGPVVALPVTIIPTGLGVEIPWDSSVYTDDNRNWAANYNGKTYTGKGWTVMMRTETTHTDVAANPADPGRIVSGGDMDIDTSFLRNRDSQILSGGRMTVNPSVVDNTPTQGQKIVENGGSLILVPGVKGNNLVPGSIAVQTSVYTIDIGTSERAEFVNATSGTGPGAAAGVNVTDRAGSAGGVNGSTRPGTILEVASAVGGYLNTGGSTAGSANGASGASGASAGKPVSLVVRTSTPTTVIPNASLFGVNAGPGRYLVATDPRFTNYKNWLSSDYLLNNLGLDPDNTLKRLGDGFYEQKLIREQVAQLTGYRYLDGFDNDSDQYTALMNAGATFAKKLSLKPGVALTAVQMAQLTSDIVWLVEQTVTLPDGSTQKVLAPQVYVRVQPGDITGGGSLMSADAMVIRGSGDLNNRGTIAGRSLVSINADNVNNLGGRIAGGNVGINARNDLNNIGGTISGADSVVLTAGRNINIETTTQSTAGVNASRTNVDRIAGVYVTNPGGVLIASAGNDVNVIAGVLSSAGSASIGAGRNINLGTVTESASRSMAVAGGSGKTRAAGGYIESSSKDIGSVIVADGNVRLAAGNDLNVRASAVASNDGALVATAKNNINLTAGQATTSMATGVVESSKKTLSKTSTSNLDGNSQTDVLSSSMSGKTVALVAGNDINAQAAQLQSKEAMSLSAGRDINLTTATRSTTELSAQQSKTSATGLAKGIGYSTAAVGGGPGVIAGAALTGSKSSNGSSAVTDNVAVGTTISAGSLQTVSGRDTTLQAATVVADRDVTMLAGRNLTIESAQNTRSELSYDASSKSGMIGKWSNPSIGNVKGSNANSTQSTSQQSSQVASLTGNVTLVAGNEYRQTASSVLAAGQAGPLAGGDVNILAKNVTINEAYNTSQSVTVAKNSSTVLGGSAYIGGLSTNMIGNAQSTIRAMGDVGGDGRMQALGAVNLALSGKQAYDTATSLASTGAAGLSYGVSASLSRNTAQSTSVTNSSTAVGSSVVGANNVNIVATGGGKDSNILVSGSTIAAGNTANLAADNNITLQASKDTSTTVGQNSSNGASVGVTFGAGAQNGLSIQLGVSQGKGSNNQLDTRYNATQVSGGNAVNISSGGNLTMNGAVVAGNRVTADVGGDLNITTLQDVSVGQSRQSSSGLNVSLCIPPICYGAVVTASASAAGAKGDGFFVSPNTQSGIKAGDGGFDVNVKGNTNLTGAVIESTQAAIDGKRNNFQTGGQLTMTDLQNVSQSSGSSYAVSGGVSIGYNSTPTAATETAAAKPSQFSWSVPNGKPTGSAGVGSYEGNNQSSTTRSGISGIAGDQSVRTGNTASAGTLVKDWNTQKIVQNVQAQAQITQQFNQNAAREIGTYADKKYKELKDTDPAEAAKWAEGGVYRVALHTAAGALGGGVAGAIGAGASAALMPRIGAAIESMGLPAPVAQALGAVTAAAIGGIVGGTAGAASAIAVDINNRQMHPDEARLISNNARRYAQQRFNTDNPTGDQINQAEIELTRQSLRNFDSAHAQRLGADNPQAQAFLSTLGAGQNAVDPLTGQTYQLFSADATTRDNHAMFGEYVRTNMTEQALLDRAYTRVIANTISGVNGSFAGALTGSVLSLNDAARDYGNMRQQPAAVQWGVLSELREERQANLQRQLSLTEELQQLNARGDATPQAAQRRGQMISDLTLLDYENQTLRGASVEQIRAMGSAGLLRPIDQREWGEGIGQALGAGGLNLRGASTAGLSGRITMLRGALAEAQASSAAARAEADVARVRIESNVNADGTFAGGVPIRPRDGATPPGTAQTDTPIGRHLIEAGVITDRKTGLPTGISGGHNMTNFNQTLQANGGRALSTVEAAPGIYEIKYTMPGMKPGDVQIKTVYDPARYSDQQMASMANDAAAMATYQWMVGGGVSSKEFVNVNGVKFEVPIGAYKGKIYVPTAYPSGK